MKYLKLYESDNYYEDVTSYWRTVDPSIDHLLLDDNEVNTIKNIVKSTSGRWSLSKTQKTLNFQSGKTAIESRIISNFTKIDDEYYIISLFDRNDGLTYYYKCDQLDGLKRCVEDKINWRARTSWRPRWLMQSEHNSIYQQEIQESQSWNQVGSDRTFDFDKAEKFTNSEWIEINNIFSSDYTSNTYQSPASGAYLQGIYKVFDIKINDNRNEIKFLYYSQSRYAGNDLRFVIYKLPDEWFFIVDRNRYKFYNCDQFDGLVDCLKKNFYV